MKSINDYILETSNDSKTGIFGEFEKPKKLAKYGFMVYDENSGAITGIHTNSAEELAETTSSEHDMYNDLFILEVGKSIELKNQGVWCRIW